VSPRHGLYVDATPFAVNPSGSVEQDHDKSPERGQLELTSRKVIITGSRLSADAAATIAPVARPHWKHDFLVSENGILDYKAVVLLLLHEQDLEPHASSFLLWQHPSIPGIF
jgi:hypothetical protein